MASARRPMPLATATTNSVAGGADAQTASPSAASGVTDRAREVLQQIRPAIQADGGDVELVDVTADGTAHVRFKGACIGCPSSNLTLHMGIERALRGSMPEIARVVAVP